MTYLNSVHVYVQPIPAPGMAVQLWISLVVGSVASLYWGYWRPPTDAPLQSRHQE